MELKTQIAYRSGYKYQLEYDYRHALWNVLPQVGETGNKYVTASNGGFLLIRAGYAWDGASGPTIDTKSTMRASLVHDALYQLIREGYLPADDLTYKLADAELRRILVEDSRSAGGLLSWLQNGWGSVRAWYYERAVNRFGKKHNNDKPVEVAP